MIGGYRQVNLMMSGQTSQVLEVVEVSSNRHFALKLLLPEHTRTREHRNYLYHEAHVGMQCHHTNVIRVHRLVRDRENPYIIMEFFPGRNLGARMRLKEPIVRERARRIIEQAAAGMAHINDKGWVHRDVKPDNILINGATEVRIIDFALAQRVSKGGWFRWFRRRSKTQGTRSYMSPEQIKGQPLDARADLYSFGATMYEIVTGRPPFRGSSPGDLLNRHMRERPTSPVVYNPEVTDECGNLIVRLLAKDGKDRPRDFHELLSAFRSIRVFRGEKIERPEM